MDGSSLLKYPDACSFKSVLNDHSFTHKNNESSLSQENCLSLGRVYSCLALVKQKCDFKTSQWFCCKAEMKWQ